MLGILVTALGAWTAATRRRPAWLPLRALRAETARTWGAATALAGLGLIVWGVDLLALNNEAVGVVGVLMVFAGAMWISIATPNTRRPRRPQ